MKKRSLILSAVLTMVAYQGFAQTIAVEGQNVTAAPGSTVNDQLTLVITGQNTIGQINSVNMLLRTYAQTGGLNGASFFAISGVTPISPFDTTNAPSSAFPISFNTAGDSANSGTTASDPSGGHDVGVNAPPNSSPVVNASGTTSIPFETVSLKLAPNTPVGAYNFSVTLGGVNDPGNQGSWIDDNSASHVAFDVNSVPTFTITVVPEPATWSLFGFVGIAALGFTLFSHAPSPKQNSQSQIGRLKWRQ